MKTATKAGLVGFLLALGTLHGASTSAATEASAVPPQTVESRLNRLTAAIRDREAKLPDITELGPEQSLLAGWLNGRRGDFVNGRRGGFVNSRRGGGFLNSHPWRNGWRDGGGFWNYRRW